MTKRQAIYTVLAIVLVPLLIVVGYNALVVQPSIAETQAEGRGLNFPTEVQDLRVSGEAQFAKGLSVAGDITASSIVTDGAATLTSLNVSGATVLNGGLTMDTNKFTVADTSGNTLIAGSLAANGGISADTNAFTVADTSGNTHIAGTLQVSSTLTGPAEGSVVYNTYVRKTVANINSGFTLVTVPDGLKFRLINAIATVYGAGNCSANTSIDIKADTTVLLSYAQANLVRSTPLVIGATGVTVLADDASFVQQAAGQDITVANVGTAVATCTGVDFNVSYALEP